MPDVKWIKIATDIFDDEKILLIESLPDAYAIIAVWFKLLCLAGKKNNGGVFLMNDKIPYTDKMLATIFHMDDSTVAMALSVFEQYKMIEIVDGIITIPNWNKHQTLDAYERKKERDRLYQEERRAKQRALIGKSSEKSSDKSSDVAVSDIDIDIDKDIDKSIYIRAFPSEKVKDAFSLYVLCREKNGDKLDHNQIKLLADGLKELSTDPEEQLSIIQKATVSNWKSFYPVTKKPEKKATRKSSKKNAFNNFEGRSYDSKEIDAIEGRLLSK